MGSQVPGAAAAHSERSQAVLPTDSPSLGGGGGYWAVAILFVSGLFAVGAFILYKFKRQGLASLGSPGMWVGPKGHRGLGLCPRWAAGQGGGLTWTRTLVLSYLGPQGQLATHKPGSVFHPILPSAPRTHFTDEETQAQRS